VRYKSIPRAMIKYLQSVTTLSTLETINRGNFPVTNHTIKSDVARKNWRDILDDVTGGDTFIVQRYNKPVAVVISYSEWQRIQGESEDDGDSEEL